MKYLIFCIFILAVSGLAGAEEMKRDTSNVSQGVTSGNTSQVEDKSHLPAVEGLSDSAEVTSEESTKVKEKEEAPVIQEDYALVPSIVSESFQLYREQGAEAFIKSILKGSPLEGDESSAKELERMRAVERYYGKMTRHTFINVLKISSFYKKIYIILQFAKGPVFCSIDCYYTSQNTWIIPAFTFNTDIAKVFPDILLKQYLENVK